MLRPATPLSIIFFIAFVLLLLSCLSTPVIQGIPIGSFQGYNFGVLGYCKDGKCEGPRIGYSTDGLFSGSNTEKDFSLPSDSRHSLSSILIVHPIAAFLTLICFALAVAAHFHGPSHSPRYLLALLILTFPTLLITLLAFLVDILLFVPHMQWGGWIVLGATILIIGSSIVTCAMRRTLVSRKARKKRIAENADMNGSNYYENLAQQRMMADTLPKADSPPPMSGSTAVDSKNPHATSFGINRQDTLESTHEGQKSYDDWTPLNPNSEPSIRSASTDRRRRPDENAPQMPMMGRPSQDSGHGMPRRPSRDQYGNPLPPGAEMGMGAAALRHQHSQGSLGSNRSNGYPQRGRGGFGPPSRGYGPPRGGYGPPRGGYGPRGGRGGYGPPPPGFMQRGRGGYGPPPPGMMGRGGPPPRPGPPPGYGNDPYYGAPRSGASPAFDQPPPMHEQYVAGPSMAIGQAIEMDERTGSPQRQDTSPYGLRDSDADVAGMVGLQQGEHGERSPERNGRDDAMSPSSMYSDQQYVPPRQQWSNSPTLAPQQPGGFTSQTTMNTQPSSTSDPYSSNAAASSRVLPLSPVPGSPTTSSQRGPQSPRHHRAGSEPYYEDVDPRFAQEENHRPPTQQDYHAIDGPARSDSRESGIPNALTPGPAAQYTGRMQSPHPPPPFSNHHPPPSADRYLDPHAYAPPPNVADHSNSSSSLGAARPDSLPDPLLEPIPDGARSPGEGSEASHFTSVSQRPVNPNWRPPPGMFGGPPPGVMGMGGSSAGAAQRRKEDVILNANPDFSLPGIGVPGGGRNVKRGAVGPSLLGGGTSMPAGRYPTDI